MLEIFDLKTPVQLTGKSNQFRNVANRCGGRFTVVVQNTTGGSLSEAVKLRFALIKSVNS